MARTIGEVTAVLALNAQKFEDGIKSATQSLDNFGKNVTKIGGQMSLKLTAPIVGFGIAAVAAAARTEKLKRQLQTLVGSVDAGSAAFERLVQFAIKTPFELPELVKTNNMLIGFGLNARQAYESMELLGNVAAATGGNLNGMALAFGQAAAGGKLMTRDLWQLVNNGVPILKMLSDSMGVAEGAIMGMAEKGQITFPVVVKAFQEAAGEGGKYANAMKDVSMTIGGVLTNMKDSFGLAFAEIGTDLVEATRMKDILWALKDVIDGAVVKFKELSPAVKTSIFAFGGFVAILGPALIAIGQMSLGVSAIAGVLGALTAPVGLAILAIAALATSFLYVYENWEAFKERFKDASWWKNALIDLVKLFNTYNPFSAVLKAYNSFIGLFGVKGLPDPFEAANESLDAMKVDTNEYKNDFMSFGDSVISMSKRVGKNLIDYFVTPLNELQGFGDMAGLGDVGGKGGEGLGGGENAGLTMGSFTGFDSMGDPFKNTRTGASTFLDLMGPLRDRITEANSALTELQTRGEIFGDSAQQIAGSQLSFLRSEIERMRDAGVTSGEYYDFIMGKLNDTTKAYDAMADAAKSASITALDGITNLLGGMKELAGDSVALALLEIAAKTAQGIASAVAAGAGLVFPANIGAIATGVGAVLSGMAQAKQAISGVPKLARGGMVTGPTLAMIGDNASGREAVIPFERMGEFMNMMGGAQAINVNVTGEFSGDTLRFVMEKAEKDKLNLR
jgi:tape measure domain-containing protein